MMLYPKECSGCTAGKCPENCVHKEKYDKHLRKYAEQYNLEWEAEKVE